MPTHARQAMSLQRALLGTIVLALLGGVVPAAVVLDQRLAGVLEARAREDLALAPRIVADRLASTSDAMMMRAKDFSRLTAMGVALEAGDRESAQRLSEAVRPALGGDPIVIGPTGSTWIGTGSTRLLEPLIARTRRGELPVTTLRDGATFRDVALAPVVVDGRWIGAVGVTSPLDDAHAATLAGLTRADVIVLDTGTTTDNSMTSAAGFSRRDVTTTTLDAVLAVSIGRVITGRRDGGGQPPDGVHDVTIGGRRLIVVTARQRDAGRILLVRDLDAELAVVPELRRIALLSALAALLSALVVGAVLSARVARPVAGVARAANALAQGDFAAPLRPVRQSAFTIREVAQVEGAFSWMRERLADRLHALSAANDALADRNLRLSALQADLVQRERLAATGRLVVQLAHEIRNPVASLRNCLELIRRRVMHDPEAREFTELAVDELLRMHELAEQMLDLNRPRAGAGDTCIAAVVTRHVAALCAIGVPSGVAVIDCNVESEAETAAATIDADALKQVLINLVQNANEATLGQPGGRVRLHLTVDGARLTIAVRDNGPGIPPDILPRVFDPFFTTKRDMRGVGLGLFIAEGLVRAAGGELVVEPNVGITGTTFHVRLPVMTMAGAVPDRATGSRALAPLVPT